MKKKILPKIAGALVAISLVSSLAWQAFAENIDNTGDTVNIYAGETNTVSFELEQSLSPNTEEENCYIAGEEITFTGRLTGLSRADGIESYVGVANYRIPVKWNAEIFDIVSIQKGSDIPEGTAFTNTYETRPQQVVDRGELMVQWQTNLSISGEQTLADIPWLFEGDELFTLVLKVKDTAPIGAAFAGFFADSYYPVSAAVGLANKPCTATYEDPTVYIVDELSIIKTFVDEVGEEIKTAEVTTALLNDTYSTTVDEIDDYDFTQASVDGQLVQPVNNEIVINVSKRHHVQLQYAAAAPRSTFDIVIEYIDEDGNHFHPTETDTVNAGDRYTKSVPSIPGYVIKAVLLDGVDNGSNVIDIQSVERDYSVEFTFERESFDIVIEYIDQDGKSFHPTETDTVKYGDEYHKDVPQIPGYTIDKIIVDGVPIDSTTEIDFDSVTSGHDVKFTFTKDDVYHDITIEYVDEDGNHFYPTETDRVKDGEDYHKVVPQIPGYVIDKIYVDGVAIDSTTAIDLKAVTSGHDVKFSFKKDNSNGNNGGNAISTNNSNPKTGDATTAVLFVVMLLAATLLTAVVVKKKRTK